MTALLGSLLVALCLIGCLSAVKDAKRHRQQQQQQQLHSSAGTSSSAITGITSSTAASSSNGKRVNVLIILADDLGYGDTSVFPFMGSGIQTPQLEKMAARGTILTNFHSAAPVCTPTRLSILTGMFPWRLGVKGVYEYGEKGKSNRDDWLAAVPTLAMAFREANYFTGHSGKWHAGGMRNDDWEMRRQPATNGSYSYSIPGNRRCHHPGPNQQGFEDYVSVLDGPGAPRQNELQVNSVLYSQGCEHLLRNDSVWPYDKMNVGPEGLDIPKKEYLFDCEVNNAIRMMKDSIAMKKPFFIQVWFHAPHGPWEYIPEYQEYYMRSRPDRLAECLKRHGNNEPYCHLAVKPVRRSPVFDRYNTMVTGMDNSIGTLLHALTTLGIERDTIVVFLSDNGPENEAGTVGHPMRSTSGLRGNKRYLYEGGIRVPCIWQWPGTIARGRESAVMSVTTDLYPTLLDAANIPLPVTARVDGISLLPELKGHTSKFQSSKKPQYVRRIYQDRMSLWHAEYEGPRSTVAILFNFKVKVNESEHPIEVFDLINDLYERENLLADLPSTPLQEIKGWALAPEALQISPSMLRLNATRSNPWLHKLLVSKTYQMLYDFANFGNEAQLRYMELNPGRIYTPTVESDVRHAVTHDIYRKTNRVEAQRIRNRVITNGFCSTPCPCDTPVASQVPTLPYHLVPAKRRYLVPHGLINATALVFESDYYARSFL